MSGKNTNRLFQIWSNTLPDNQDPPFANKDHLYDSIDEIHHGDVPWQSFHLSYTGELDAEPEPWKLAKYDVYYRDPRQIIHQQLGNRSFETEMDYAPKRVFDKAGNRRYRNFMSGEWAWRHVVSIYFVFV